MSAMRRGGGRGREGREGDGKKGREGGWEGGVMLEEGRSRI